MKGAGPLSNLSVWEPRFPWIYMGLRGLTGTIRDHLKAAVAPATTQFHWEEQIRKTVCLLLRARGSRLEPRPDQLPQRLPTTFLTVQPLQGWTRKVWWLQCSLKIIKKKDKKKICTWPVPKWSEKNMWLANYTPCHNTATISGYSLINVNGGLLAFTLGFSVPCFEENTLY